MWWVGGWFGVGLRLGLGLGLDLGLDLGVGGIVCWLGGFGCWVCWGGVWGYADLVWVCLCWICIGLVLSVAVGCLLVVVVLWCWRLFYVGVGFCTDLVWFVGGFWVCLGFEFVSYVWFGFGMNDGLGLGCMLLFVGWFVVLMCGFGLGVWVWFVGGWFVDLG